MAMVASVVEFFNENETTPNLLASPYITARSVKCVYNVYSLLFLLCLICHSVCSKT